MSVDAFRAGRDFLQAHAGDAAALAGFSWPVVERFNWALDWFDGELAKGVLRDAPALIITGPGAVRLSFAELSERSSRVANGLRALGVGRGDRILLMLGNVAPLWEVMLGAMKLGAVVVPATTLLTAADLVERVARARVRVVVAAAADAGKFSGLADEVLRISVGAAAGCVEYATLSAASGVFVADGVTRGDDPLLLYFTSGTTAAPKLVLHSHRSYPVGHLSTMHVLGLRAGDVHLNISSAGWAKHAWSCLFAPWNAGAAVFIANQPRFDARAMLDAIVAGGVTTLCAPPTVWRMFIQQDLRGWKTALREVAGAGEPLNPEIIDRVFAAWGLMVRDFYGQTETTAQIGNAPGMRLKPGSMGRALPGYSVRLLGIDGTDVEEGEIALSLSPAPAGLMQGYQGEDGAIVPPGVGFYRTGDIARRDAEGYFVYVGRADDVFKASDYRISPFELESVLIEHPDVAEAAVVPAPDALRAAVPKAYIALGEGVAPTAATALSIFRHLRGRLAAYQRVRRIEFAVLPKTISGKIRRVELRRAEEARLERGAEEFREEDFPELRDGGV